MGPIRCRSVPSTPPPVRGTRARPRETLALLALSILLSACAGRGVRDEPPTPTIALSSALILDQLSLTDPNPAFVREATALLEGAGYRVDYVPGEEATVALHRGLPTRGDAIVLLRSHAARIGALAADGESLELGDDVAVFSGEPIDLERYRISGVPPAAATAVAAALDDGPDQPRWAAAETLSAEEVADLMPVFYDPDTGELPFFGIRPDFVAERFQGEFPGTTVLMMGCDGLRGDAMAEAFLGRGAAHFVSWDRSVSAAHTDAATLDLLERWLVEGQDLEAAVAATAAELGPDPYYEGRLRVASAD